MTKLLLRLFVKDYKNTQSEAVRDRYGKLSGITCILLNIMLAGGKIAVGLLFGAISVLADGLNNLTDCGSNIVSLISFKMASKPADKEHPFGHQRVEYVSAMIVGIIVLVLAFELGSESFNKIISPEQSDFSWITVGVLCASILVKLWMFLFNRKLGKMINSEVLKATSVDSISDSIATASVTIALVISYYTGVNLDGYMGIAVAIFIAVAGIGILRSTISKLVGQAPDKDMIDSIKQRIMSFEGVHSMHDLTVHSYGHSKFYASVHVEVDSNVSVMATHDLADRIERDFAQNTDINLIVHIDPVVLDDPEVDKYQQLVCEVVNTIDQRFSVHDFRLVKGVTHSNLVFDVAIPFDTKLSEAQILEQLTAKLQATDPNLFVVANIEKQVQ